ncbi:MAG: PDGLE domain-containing protein [Candidatus Bathyarchaeia archaeon]
MKKLLLLVGALMVAFAVLLPFASKTPDGLETLTEDAGNQQGPVWNGLLADYSAALADPYVSTLVAGLLGTALVLVVGFGLGKSLTTKNKA